jgi:hypothetical protein
MITRRLLITSIILTVATALVGCYTHLNERPAISASVDDYPIDRVIEDIVYSAADWPQPTRSASGCTDDTRRRLGQPQPRRYDGHQSQTGA